FAKVEALTLGPPSDEPLCNPDRIPPRHRYERAAERANIAALVVLLEGRGRMAGRIVIDLLRQSGGGAPMVVEGDRRRLVAADPSGAENAVPVLRIARTACRTDIEALVEEACLGEDLASEGHAGAGADFPGRTPVGTVAGEEFAVERDGPIAAPETPVGFEIALRLRLELRGKH